MTQKTALTKQQKEAVGLLSIGSFLEYFDLMLYVHMAVLLNDLFFSKTDSFSGSLLSAFAFSSTFLFRPVGALLIGWLGDTYGRKYTVILTTFTMALACVCMASLPTYAQIGVSASVAVTMCRILQGISSMGEQTGAEIYLTEMIKPPKVWSAVAFTNVCSYLGTMCALFVAKISLSHNYNWRVAFWIGAIVAFIGIFARTYLRETPEFANASCERAKLRQDFNASKKEASEQEWYKEKVNNKLALSLFFIQLSCPVFHLYFIYIHSANILKDSFGYSTAEIINHNFMMSIFHLIEVILITFLVSFIHPLKILKIQYIIATPIILLLPFILNNISDVFGLTLIQLFVVFFMPSEFPAVPIFCKAFPVFKRFTSICVIFALSRALMYLVSSFGIIYLIKYFGNYGLLVLFAPVIMCYGWGLSQFIKHYGEKTKEGLIST